MIDYEAPVPLTETMKDGLARLYSDPGIRAYLENAKRIANANVLSSLKADKPDAAKEYTIRLDTLDKLLEKGRSLFNQGVKGAEEPLLAIEKHNEAEIQRESA